MNENLEKLSDKKDLIEQLKELIGITNLNVLVKKLDERAVMPTYAHKGDVGMDMTAISVEYDEMNDLYVYHTGLAFESKWNIGQFLFPRSSNRKTDCYLANSVGIADSAIYRGEIMFCYKPRISTFERANTVALKAFAKALRELDSFDKESVDKCYKEAEIARKRVFEMTKNLEFAPYKVGDRIGQMVFLPYPTINLLEVKELSDSERGSNGFGSSGN